MIGERWIDTTRTRCVSSFKFQGIQLSLRDKPTGDDANRGMNAPATGIRSLRDQDIARAELNQVAAQSRDAGRGATIEGSRAFQRPIGTPIMPFRREVNQKILKSNNN